MQVRRGGHRRQRSAQRPTQVWHSQMRIPESGGASFATQCPLTSSPGCLAAHVHAGAILSTFCARGHSALLLWTALHQRSVSVYHRRCGCGAEQHPAGGTVVRRLRSRFPGRCGVGPPCHQPGTPGAVKCRNACEELACYASAVRLSGVSSPERCVIRC